MKFHPYYEAYLTEFEPYVATMILDEDMQYLDYQGKTYLVPSPKWVKKVLERGTSEATIED